MNIIKREKLRAHHTYKRKAFIGSVLLNWCLNFDTIRAEIERAERKLDLAPEIVECEIAGQFSYFGNVSTISNLKWKSCWAIVFCE